VADDNIITGQNPASSIQTAKLVLTLAHRKKKLRNLKASEKSIQTSISDDKRIY
jgi:putative intracellular protease/amidase